MNQTHHLRNRLRCSTLLTLLCFIGSLMLSAGASAQNAAAPIEVVLQPATTSIHWTLGTNIHIVHGTFALKSGVFRIDPVTGDASGLIVIDATSGQSGDSSRDNRMHREILDSGRYPTIAFRPTHVAGKINLAVPGLVTVDGVFTLHGQDHPMQITVNLNPKVATIALATHFTVPFVAWGLKDPSTFIFRTEKQVTLDVDATIVPTATGARVR